MGHAANPRDEVVRLTSPSAEASVCRLGSSNHPPELLRRNSRGRGVVPHETGEAVARLSPAAGRDVRNGPPSGVGRGRTGQRDG